MPLVAIAGTTLFENNALLHASSLSTRLQVAPQTLQRHGSSSSSLQLLALSEARTSVTRHKSKWSTPATSRSQLHQTKKQRGGSLNRPDVLSSSPLQALLASTASVASIGHTRQRRLAAKAPLHTLEHYRRSLSSSEVRAKVNRANVQAHQSELHAHGGLASELQTQQDNASWSGEVRPPSSCNIQASLSGSKTLLVKGLEDEALDTSLILRINTHVPSRQTSATRQGGDLPLRSVGAPIASPCAWSSSAATSHLRRLHNSQSCPKLSRAAATLESSRSADMGTIDARPDSWARQLTFSRSSRQVKPLSGAPVSMPNLQQPSLQLSVHVSAASLSASASFATPVQPTALARPAFPLCSHQMPPAVAPNASASETSCSRHNARLKGLVSDMLGVLKSLF